MDYRHTDRPQVSIIIAEPRQSGGLAALRGQRVATHALSDIMKLLIADNHSQSPELLAWLDNLEQNGRGRIRGHGPSNA